MKIYDTKEQLILDFEGATVIIEETTHSAINEIFVPLGQAYPKGVIIRNAHFDTGKGVKINAINIDPIYK